MKEKAKMISKSNLPSLQSDADSSHSDDKPVLNITTKHKEFVQKIVVDGLKPVDAYLSIYPNVSRKNASSAASRLLKHPSVVTEFQSLAVHLKALEHAPKYQVMKELKELLAVMKRPGKDYNPKYIIECLDMINKMMGYYNHTTTNVSIKVDKSISFGGFDPSDAEFVDITPSKDDE